jgi:hypothetical protein
MTIDVDLQLMTRPDSGSVVSLVAERLRVRLLDERSGETHDRRVRRDERMHPVKTLAPVGAPGWATDAAAVWNRIEWTERAGASVAVFEIRTSIPDTMDEPAARDFAWGLAGFVSRELDVPVSYVVFDEAATRVALDIARPQVRLCFPTRRLAEPGTKSILDRSGNPSGFGGRLPMAGNPHLGKSFAAKITREAVRLRDLQQVMETPRGSLSRIAKNPFEFDFEADMLVVAMEADPKTHPLVARLRREAPRSMNLPDLRDFEHAMSLAMDLEDALKAVVECQATHTGLGEQYTRVRAHVLDHEFHLDVARRRRSLLAGELKALEGTRRGLRSALVSALFGPLGQGPKRAEVRQACEHVQSLKAAVSSLRAQVDGLGSEKAVTGHALGRVRDELKECVRRLNGSDPRVLVHLLGILNGRERDCLKSAMAKALPQVDEGLADPGKDEGKSGPPARPSRARAPGH